jgi:hypothetical protein
MSWQGAGPLGCKSAARALQNTCRDTARNPIVCIVLSFAEFSFVSVNEGISHLPARQRGDVGGGGFWDLEREAG